MFAVSKDKIAAETREVGGEAKQTKKKGKRL